MHFRVAVTLAMLLSSMACTRVEYVDNHSLDVYVEREYLRGMSARTLCLIMLEEPREGIRTEAMSALLDKPPYQISAELERLVTPQMLKTRGYEIATALSTSNTEFALRTLQSVSRNPDMYDRQKAYYALSRFPDPRAKAILMRRLKADTEWAGKWTWKNGKLRFR